MAQASVQALSFGDDKASSPCMSEDLGYPILYTHACSLCYIHACKSCCNQIEWLPSRQQFHYEGFILAL